MDFMYWLSIVKNTPFRCSDVRSEKSMLCIIWHIYLTAVHTLATKHLTQASCITASLPYFLRCRTDTDVLYVDFFEVFISFYNWVNINYRVFVVLVCYWTNFNPNLDIFQWNKYHNYCNFTLWLESLSGIIRKLLIELHSLLISLTSIEMFLERLLLWLSRWLLF